MISQTILALLLQHGIPCGHGAVCTDNVSKDGLVHHISACSLGSDWHYQMDKAYMIQENGVVEIVIMPLAPTSCEAA